MNDDVAIKVENVSKTFRLPLEKQSSLKSKLINFNKRGYENLEVLRDISFEVKKGEFFGIVGRNGSGKSTLLKLISGIYSPTQGSIRVNGKLTPFIELGVGFNPELSGRDNVFLNGSLLGFSRKEMEAMYGDIVEFAELEKFMDQKLKNYSSGMQVRLAFSIAIRANTDILVLDEVLAVGDAAFQQKCNDYFEMLRKDERKTVILVTHSMDSVEKYCSRALLIHNGDVKLIGSPHEVANQYIIDNLSAHDDDEDRVTKGMSVSGNVKSIRIKPKSPHVMSRDDTLEFDVEYEYSGNVRDLYLGISLLYRNVSIIEHGTIGVKATQNNGRKIVYRYRLPLNRFTQGNFTIAAAVLGIKEKNLVAFTTEEGNFNFVITNEGKTVGGLLIEKGEWA